MVWQNRDPGADLTVIEGSDVTKQKDGPDHPRTSLYDGGNWNAQSREELGIKLFSRLEVPNTNKFDMKVYADLLHGLATKMEQIAVNTHLSEHEANIVFQSALSRTNFLMKERAKIDLRDQKNRGVPRKQTSRLDTKSS